MLTTLMRLGDRDKCDFSSFEEIYLTGSAVSADLINEIKVSYLTTKFRLVSKVIYLY